MQIEYIENNDIDSIKNFQIDGWDGIEKYFRFYIDSSFAHPIKLTENDKTIAIGSVIIHKDVAWFAHIITLSDYRRYGFGTTISKKL